MANATQIKYGATVYDVADKTARAALSEKTTLDEVHGNLQSWLSVTDKSDFLKGVSNYSHRNSGNKIEHYGKFGAAITSDNGETIPANSLFRFTTITTDSPMIYPFVGMLLNSSYEPIGTLVVRADSTADNNGQLLYFPNSSDSGSVTVDTELDSTSENPVQNKVVTTALEGKQAKSSVVCKLANAQVRAEVSDDYSYADYKEFLADVRAMFRTLQSMANEQGHTIVVPVEILTRSFGYSDDDSHLIDTMLVCPKSSTMFSTMPASTLGQAVLDDYGNGLYTVVLSDSWGIIFEVRDYIDPNAPSTKHSSVVHFVDDKIVFILDGTRTEYDINSEADWTAARDAIWGTGWCPGFSITLKTT